MQCNKLGDIHFRDPGYEPGYPPEPEICLRAYQNPTADDDDDDDDDNGDDTDFDDGKNKRDINNSNSIKTSTSNNDINRFDESRKHMNDKSSPGRIKIISQLLLPLHPTNSVCFFLLLPFMPLSYERRK